MVDVTDIPLEALQALIDSVRPFFLKLSVVVGGIFGLYLVLILVRVYYERKKVKLLKDIRFDLDQLNIHHNLPYSKTQKKFFSKVGGFFRAIFRRRKLPKDKKNGSEPEPSQIISEKKEETDKKEKNKIKEKGKFFSFSIVSKKSKK